MFASCWPIEQELVDETTAPSTVRLITRAADGGSFEAPLHAYAFDANGSLIAHQQSDAATDFRLSIPQQTDIRIVVLSADPEMYDIPSSPSLTSLITMKAPTSASGSLAKGYTTSPLQMGFVDVNPQSDNSTVTIQMHYQVASLSIQFQCLPVVCTSVYVSVAVPANGLTFRGTTEGTTVFTRTFQNITFNRGKIRKVSTNLFTGTVDAVINFEDWTDDTPIVIP